MNLCIVGAETRFCSTESVSRSYCNDLLSINVIASVSFLFDTCSAGLPNHERGLENDLILLQRDTLYKLYQHFADHVANFIDRLVECGQRWVGVLCHGDVVKASDGHVFSDDEAPFISCAYGTKCHQVIAGNDGGGRVGQVEKNAGLLKTAALGQVAFPDE